VRYGGAIRRAYQPEADADGLPVGAAVDVSEDEIADDGTSDGEGDGEVLSGGGLAGGVVAGGAVDVGGDDVGGDDGGDDGGVDGGTDRDGDGDGDGDGECDGLGVGVGDGDAVPGSAGTTRVALAGVAPVPWLLEGSLDDATPLPRNAYKVDVARALVKRALAAVAPG